MNAHVATAHVYWTAVDAAPFLAEVARHLTDLHFDVVLIGSAALQGAPVTTVDFDFMFRKTPLNLRKMKALAAKLRATDVISPTDPVAAGNAPPAASFLCRPR